MTKQISVYVEDWQYNKLQKEENQSEVVRKALKKYYGGDNMRVINIMELNSNGVDVNDKNTGTPAETRYFNDNGALPDGNFDESNIKGFWVHVEGKHEIGEYAYRVIDDSTLIRLSSLGRIEVDADWLEENDLEMLGWVTENNYWGRCFDEVPDRDTAVVRIEFDERGTRVYATTSIVDDVQQSLNNQPAWGEDSYEDWTKEKLEKYLELI